MNKVLSIYNEWAFCEIVLPSVKNEDYSFLLNSTLFHLRNAEAVLLECIQGKWSFRRDNAVSIVPIDVQDADPSLAIHDSSRYQVATAAGEKLTILAQDRDAPLQVYSKYVAPIGQEISIGFAAENQIRYHLPAGLDGKSFISHRHCVIRYNIGGAVLRDFSSNGTYINNIRVNGEKTLEYGDSIRVFGLHMIFLGAYMAFNSPPGMETDLRLATPEELEALSADKDEAGDSGKTLFFRSPRFVPKIIVEKITIDPPPDPKEQPKVSLFMQIGPAMTMALPMLMGSGMTIYAAQMSGGANPIIMMTGLVTAVGSAFIGAFWAMMNMRFSKKAAKGAENKRLQKYGQYLLDKQNTIDEIYRHTSDAYHRKYPHPNELLAFDATSEKLWSRNWNHKDILSYRLGVGNMPFPSLPPSQYILL